MDNANGSPHTTTMPFCCGNGANISGCLQVSCRSTTILKTGATKRVSKRSENQFGAKTVYDPFFCSHD